MQKTQAPGSPIGVGDDRKRQRFGFSSLSVIPDVSNRGSSVFVFAVSLLRFVCGGERRWIPNRGLSLTFLIEDRG